MEAYTKVSDRIQILSVCIGAGVDHLHYDVGKIMKYINEMITCKITQKQYSMRHSALSIDINVTNGVDAIKHCENVIENAFYVARI